MLIDEKLIRLALEEDLGHGDVTTEALVDSRVRATARIIAKETLVLAGLEAARRVFFVLDPGVDFRSDCKDGDSVEAGSTVATVSAGLGALLSGERTALNFLQHLSGIATLTRRFVEKVGGSPVRLTDTRKTTPGLRKLEKYAVRMGGGHNHRFGLYDGILIKDNHIRACGGIAAAVAGVRAKKGHLLRIEVETKTLDEVREALENDVDVIMLDNMDPGAIRKAVKLIAGRALVEVSGGVSLDDVAQLAATGVDVISIGALTHSARAVDISMDIT